MKVGYLVNQYPKVSHSFIRREILALEAQGLPVKRYALRGWDAELVDATDQTERTKTRYLVQGGGLSLLSAIGRLLVRSPALGWSGLHGVWTMWRGGSRSLGHHVASLGEAALLKEWVAEDGVGHVHAHFGTNSAEVAYLLRRIGGPTYSFTAHGADECDEPKQLKLHEKIAESAFAVGISSYMRSQLVRWARADDVRKLKVVHCGVDDAFKAGAAEPIPDAPRLVCVGRLCKEKAQVLLVEAIAALKRQGVRVELVLAGDGDTRSEVEAIIAREGLSDQVSITGWIDSDRVKREILAARAMVLPSLMEGLPVVIMESLALRRPVIASQITGIPELVRDGQEGFLCIPGSVESLSEAIRRCIDTPTPMLEAMGQRGRERVLERHDSMTEAAKLRHLFLAQGAA